MIAEEDKKFLSVTLADEAGSTNVQREYDYFVPWSDLLIDFITLLEASGYGGVKERISLRDSPFLSERWDGLVHPETEDDQ